jgi:hypothetical protein
MWRIVITGEQGVRKGAQCVVVASSGNLARLFGGRLDVPLSPISSNLKLISTVSRALAAGAVMVPYALLVTGCEGGGMCRHGPFAGCKWRSHFLLGNQWGFLLVVGSGNGAAFFG